MLLPFIAKHKKWAYYVMYDMTLPTNDYVINTQAMGVSSADDRAIFKREIKTLRQHAERQRKLLEKQRKDEKKKKKRQFV